MIIYYTYSGTKIDFKANIRDRLNDEQYMVHSCYINNMGHGNIL